jgi:hypothetical protein
VLGLRLFLAVLSLLEQVSSFCIRLYRAAMTFSDTKRRVRQNIELVVDEVGVMDGEWRGGAGTGVVRDE